MTEKGHFCTFRLGYLKILTYRKNLKNGFVFMTSKSFEVTCSGLWVQKSLFLSAYVIKACQTSTGKILEIEK